MSRARRSLFAAATATGGAVLVMLVGFVTTPILLRHLGAERFGAFRAETDWFGYVGLLEFGIGGALIAVFAKALGRDDRGGVVAGVRAGLRAYLLAAGLMVVVAACLLAAMPALLRVSDGLAAEVWAGGGVFMLSLLWMPLAVARPLAEAGQGGYRVNLLLTLQQVVILSTSVAAAVAGAGLVGQFAAVALGGAVFHVTLALMEFRRYPELRTATPLDPTPLWALSWPTLLFNFSGRLGLLTDNILLAAILGPAAVTPFLLTQRFVQAAVGQVNVISGATWAGLMDLWYRGEHDVFARRLAQLTRLTATVGAAVLVPVAVWNRPLVELWLGPDSYAGPLVTWLAAVNAWLLTTMSVWGWPLNAGGKVRAVVPSILTSASVNLTASAAATVLIGVPGPLVGSFVALGGVSWWWVLRLLRLHFGQSAWRLVVAAGRPLLVAVPFTAAVVLLAEVVPAYDPTWPRWGCWLALAGWVGGSAGAFLVAAWWLVLPPADRVEWEGRLTGRLNG